MIDVEAAYGAVADQYVDLFGRVDRLHPDDLALVEEHLSIHDGVVLDLGCRPGHITARLAARGVRTFGVDLTQVFLEHARTAHGLHRIVRAPIGQLPLPDASAAGLLAWYSLIHLAPSDVDAVLAELGRVAAPGARLIVGFFDGDEIARFPHRVTTASTWPINELSSCLNEAGFIEIERLCRPADPDTGTRPHAALVVAR